MEFTCRMVSAAADTTDAVRQLDAVFGDAFVRLATAEIDALSGMSGLCIFVTMMHPALLPGEDTRRGSYHKASNIYYVTRRLTYEDWLKPDWSARTLSYAATVKGAINRLAKTRITADERARLLDIADRAAAEAIANAPLKGIALGNVTQTRTAAGEHLGFGFKPPEGFTDTYGMPRPEGWQSENLSFEEVWRIVKSQSAVPTDPEAFKLYRRDDTGLHYYEAWGHEGEITEHRGLCGTEGETIVRAYAGLSAGEKIISRLKAQGRAEGYRAISRSKHRTLVVEIPVDGFGEAGDLDLRHQMEGHFDNRLGWLGSGHCDGGSTGSGTMEIFCIVVDVAIAKAAILKELAALELESDTRLYEMK